MAFELGTYMLMLVSMTIIDLDARSQWVSRGEKKSDLNYFDIKEIISIKLATTVEYFVLDCDFENKLYGLTILLLHGCNS